MDFKIENPRYIRITQVKRNLRSVYSLIIRLLAKMAKLEIEKRVNGRKNHSLNMVGHRIRQLSRYYQVII